MSRSEDNEAKARAERLAAALRANLKRRKTQARGRQAEAGAGEESAREANAGQAETVGPPADAGVPAVDKAGNSGG
ncbi:hypothetical protein [Ancylobacter sp. G4_0304]|uniref:hypothetical protein n=1 Tax=Ancylobacter sp. G4_0304 TaxID=3114289 RepID=UPI0039C61CB9